ncbi:MAG: TerB family tellurite resistance protein [Cyclobacteriaceae bacterium]|nr:TerB family tellurite resistance protein [Cyclobacteriaceae bacterium]
MSPAPTFKSFSDLAAYLMVYVALVDGQVHYLEEATLNDRVGQFCEDPDQALLQATQVVKASTFAKIDEVMKANESLIRDSSYDERMNLIESLYSVINSDGRVQEAEMQTLRAVRTGLEQFTAPAPTL